MLRKRFQRHPFQGQKNFLAILNWTNIYLFWRKKNPPPVIFPNPHADAAVTCLNNKIVINYMPHQYAPFIYISVSNGCLLSAIGTDYAGTESTTQNGHTCQAWASQSPQSHTMVVSQGAKFPNGEDEYSAKNYCRNPDGWSQGPWCYTADPNVRWDNCKIPLCGRVENIISSRIY